MDRLTRADKPSQQTSPPSTPRIISFPNEIDGAQELQPTNTNHVDPDEEPLVAVIGCGYVGTQLISSFSSQYDVLGFDVSPKQIQKLEAELGGEGSRATFTLDPRDLNRATHFLVSVPTLLQADRTIDTTYIKSALMNIRSYGRDGCTVVIESSVAIGMTRALLTPLAKEKGFFVGMSPERVDPGRTDPPMKSIPKVLSGMDDTVPGSLAAISRLYSRVFDTIVEVSSPETAEMTKLYENCQRMVAITYANEMADACVPLGIDPYEVCRAASTKPFGYMPYTPGLGVGGHCIPVNPYYLIHTSEFPVLEMATETMWRRPERIGKRILESFFPRERENPQTVELKPSILVVGVGFKKGQSHLSNSPGLKLVQTLADSNRVDVKFADALVEQSAIPTIPRLDMADWNKETLESFDLIVIAFEQVDMDFSVINELDKVKIMKFCP
ncbi:hypothetical protein M426DRAFT_264736 [Hypoxylon sp. CI-4A]|nr:hypothetical protein M426DRAFT_264736 [Hypoxylon sp. CI-4A]